jgi:hypothetical protein
MPGSVHVGFVVDKVALGHIFSGSSVSPVNIIPPRFHTHVVLGMNKRHAGGRSSET